MPEKVKLFTKILNAELEDLEEDFESWGQYLEEKHRTEQITEYVFLQNNAVLREEIANIRTILADIGRSPPEGVVGLKGARDHFLAVLGEETEKYQFQNAVAEFVKKRINKVYRYLSEYAETPPR